jgi:hypothetical protein
MGLLDFLNSKKIEEKTEADLILDGAESNDVLVPDHAKLPQGKLAKESVGSSLKKQILFGRFKVSGLYDTGKSLMLKGFVESGVIKRKMHSGKDKNELIVADILIGSDRVKELLPGREGAILVKYKTVPFIKYGDVLEFK